MANSILSQEVHQERVASPCRLCRGKVKTSQGSCAKKCVRDYRIYIYIYFRMTYQMTNLSYIKSKETVKTIAISEFKPHRESYFFI